MARKNEKKCAYSHCKHESKSIDIEVDDFVSESTRYYHPDCKHEKDTVLAIIDFWFKNIDEDVVFSQLRRILDRLIYNEHYEADYVLFAIKKRAKYLNHPPGIVYVVKDKDVKKSYEYQKKLQAFNESKRQPEIIQNKEPSFIYKTDDAKKSFGNIFGGK